MPDPTKNFTPGAKITWRDRTSSAVVSAHGPREDFQESQLADHNKCSCRIHPLRRVRDHHDERTSLDQDGPAVHFGLGGGYAEGIVGRTASIRNVQLIPFLFPPSRPNVRHECAWRLGPKQGDMLIAGCLNRHQVPSVRRREGPAHAARSLEARSLHPCP